MDNTRGVIIIFIVGLTVLAVSNFFIGMDVGYQRGQIDALTGTIRYELTTQPDSTRVWRRVP